MMIGGVGVENPLWLAPLAGITISSVRKFFLFLGAGLVHTEMISCAGLIRGNKKTGNMLKVSPSENPLVLQLFAGDEKTLLGGAETALDMASGSFAAISINMACPMPKVLKRGAGARLMEEPDVASAMIRELKKMGYPIWVKIRKSGEGYPLGTLAFCQLLLDSGADHICIHGRTPAQRYEGNSDRCIIYEAAAEFPDVIGASGDIFSSDDALEFLERGCSAVLFARGAMRDPFLIPKTLARMGREVDQRFIAPSIELQVHLLKVMGEDIRKSPDAQIADVLVKRFLAGMFKGVPGIAELRRQFSMIHGWDALCHLLDRSQDILERRDYDEFR